jgi:hypothetical protein
MVDMADIPDWDELWNVVWEGNRRKNGLGKKGFEKGFVLS